MTLYLPVATSNNMHFSQLDDQAASDPAAVVTICRDFKANVQVTLRRLHADVSVSLYAAALAWREDTAAFNVFCLEHSFDPTKSDPLHVALTVGAGFPKNRLSKIEAWLRPYFKENTSPAALRQSIEKAGVPDNLGTGESGKFLVVPNLDLDRLLAEAPLALLFEPSDKRIRGVFDMDDGGVALLAIQRLASSDDTARFGVMAAAFPD